MGFVFLISLFFMYGITLYVSISPAICVHCTLTLCFVNKLELAWLKQTHFIVDSSKRRTNSSSLTLFEFTNCAWNLLMIFDLCCESRLFLRYSTILSKLNILSFRDRGIMEYSINAWSRRQFLIKPRGQFSSYLKTEAIQRKYIVSVHSGVF